MVIERNDADITAVLRPIVELNLTPKMYNAVLGNMKRLDPSSLRKRYNEHSQDEYQTQLLEIVDNVQKVLASTGFSFQIKYRVKDFNSYLLKLGADEAHDPDISELRALENRMKEVPDRTKK